jgi:hypothetical protein
MPAMTLRRYRRPPGRLAWDHVLAGAVNRALADLEGIASLPQVGGPTQMIAGVPVPSAPPTRDRFLWLKVTGPNNGSAEPAYPAWAEQLDNGDGTFSDAPDGLTGGDDFLAYEVGDRDTPVGAIVPAWVSGDDPQSVTFEYTPPPEPLTVREVDGSPSVSPVTVIEFDQATGLKVTDQTGGVARVENLPATTTQEGVVTTAFQTFAGWKKFRDSIQVQASGGIGTLIVFTAEDGSSVGQIEGFGDGALLDLRLVNTAGTTRNVVRLTPGGWDLSAGVYQIGGVNGQTVTEAGVVYTGGIRTGGTLAVPGSSLSGTVDGGAW